MKTRNPLACTGRSSTLCTATAVIVLALLPCLSYGESPSLDQLLDLNPAPPADANAKPGDAKPNDAQQSDATKANESPQLILPPQAGGSPEQIFDRALENMRQASDRMGEQLDVGLQTQRLQASAVALMDQIIAEAAKQQQQQQQQQQSESAKQEKQQTGSSQNASQSKNPGPPSASGQPGPAGQGGQPTMQGQSDAKDGTTPGSAADANAADPLEEHKKQWGNLPPRLRDQLLQGMNERFSPIYQQLTEAYYRRLAEDSAN